MAFEFVAVDFAMRPLSEPRLDFDMATKEVLCRNNTFPPNAVLYKALNASTSRWDAFPSSALFISERTQLNPPLSNI